MITALIVDDEAPARCIMANLLRAHPNVEILGEAGSVTEARCFLRDQQPDLVFLDVEMPRDSGMDLVVSLGRKTRVVFVTAHENHSLRAFEIGAVDYLVKPVDPARLSLTIDRIAPPADNSKPTATRAVFFSVESATSRIDNVSEEDILWIEAEQNYTLVHMKNRPSKRLTHRTLTAWEGILDRDIFQRLSRSIIVQCTNIHHLTWKGRDETFVHFKDSEETLTLGRAGALRLKNLLKR